MAILKAVPDVECVDQMTDVLNSILPKSIITCDIGKPRLRCEKMRALCGWVEEIANW